MIENPHQTHAIQHKTTLERLRASLSDFWSTSTQTTPMREIVACGAFSGVLFGYLSTDGRGWLHALPPEDRRAPLQYYDRNTAVFRVWVGDQFHDWSACKGGYLIIWPEEVYEGNTLWPMLSMLGDK